jgi:hypothetical protein
MAITEISKDRIVIKDKFQTRDIRQGTLNSSRRTPNGIPVFYTV